MGEVKIMKKLDITLSDVNAVYDGPEGRLWELIMGEQIHVGGFFHSMVLAEKAGISEGQSVLDLCSALGGGPRFLVKNFRVRAFGLDGTRTMYEESLKRAERDGLADSIEIKFGDVMDIPWPDKSFDVVWGEDAWCYVVDKDKLITEAARVLKDGGTIAFTDWVEGSAGLSDADAERINRFMKFPYMESQRGYEALLEKNGFAVKVSEDLTPEFADYIDLYLQMLSRQLAFDALCLIGWELDTFKAMGEEMAFMSAKAREGGFGRARIVAVKV
jgi:ubiquinone/menaquinone biosynthesis C-methylase UbiE